MPKYLHIILFLQFFLVTLKGHDNDVRNIILIGRTGNGKSTLANVLMNKNDEFGQVFKEVPGGVSGTKNIQGEVFEVNSGGKKVKYRIIDTPGMSDTTSTEQEVLKKIASAIPFIEEGLHRIFFVTKGRLTKDERNVYRLLKETIFDNEVVGYTTIINPWFPEFENETACEEDRRNIEEANQELADIVKSTRMVHVSTPPLVGSPDLVKASKEVRKASRQKLIAHLNDCRGTYHPSNINTFEERVRDYLTEDEKLRRELKRSEAEKERLRREIAKEKKRREEIEQRGGSGEGTDSTALGAGLGAVIGSPLGPVGALVGAAIGAIFGSIGK